MKRNVAGFAFFLLVLAAPSQVLAYDEAVDGDLSNVSGAPTAVVFVPGVNPVIGTVRSTAPADAQDYLTFTVPAGKHLTALNVVSYTNAGTSNPGNTGYHAINAGATSFPANSQTSFLGGDHLVPGLVGTDALQTLKDGMAGAQQAGTGFTPPLGPGTYSYLVQQVSGATDYHVQFVIADIPKAPASGAWALVLLAGLLAGLGVVVQRRRA